MASVLEQRPWEAVHRELGVSPAEYDDRPLGAYVEIHAAERGERNALRYMGKVITYSQLNEQANRLANALVGLGVGRRDVIGFHTPNIPQYIIAMVAVSKIGCAGSGVSPLLTASELAYQVQDAGISVLLSFDQLAPRVLEGGVEMPASLKTLIFAGAGDYLGAPAPAVPEHASIACHSYRALLAAASPEYSQQPVSGDDTFLIQYTGGTTGRPKGAELSVTTLLNNIAPASVYRPFELAGERVATAFPYFHIAGSAVSIVALREAAEALVLPDPRDVEHICREMAALRPTRLVAVPTLYQMLIANPLSQEIDFSELRTAMSGAAPLTAETRKDLEALIGEGVLSDVFGMTETGPVYISNPPQRAKADAVGLPVPGALVAIVDVETGNDEMPQGEPGEIITAGPHVMKGYLNLPEESARAVREWRGQRWMYTGDVGYMDEEGYVHLSDRAKDMLIVGGFKVFSVEVEDKLASLDFIAQSALIGTPDEARPGNDIVNLYVELEQEARARDTTELEAEILAYCRDNLAAYKVPKRIHFIDQIPLTPVGKLDKKALRS
ncbi:MAG: AMP-binding protein [Pseudomonadota bacterium]